MLENRIDTLETYILTMEENVKFLKQVIASQNDTIKTLATMQQRSQSAVEEPITEQKTIVYEHVNANDSVNDNDSTKPKNETTSVTKPSSMVRRRLVI